MQFLSCKINNNINIYKYLYDFKFNYMLKWHIAHYIDDIDTRRKFNIYSKIDLNKYQ